MWRGEKGWREHQCLDRDEVAAQSMTIVIGHLGAVQLMGVFWLCFGKSGSKISRHQVTLSQKSIPAKKRSPCLNAVDLLGNM